MHHHTSLLALHSLESIASSKPVNSLNDPSDMIPRCTGCRTNTSTATSLECAMIRPHSKIADSVTSLLSNICVNIISKLWNSPPSTNLSRINLFRNYVHDLLISTQLQTPIVITALLLLEKLRRLHDIMSPGEGAEFRLVTTALIMANKVLDDHRFTSYSWSVVSGISTAEINTMELEFLSSLSYRVQISQQTYYAYVGYIHQYIQALNSPPHTYALYLTPQYLLQQNMQPQQSPIESATATYPTPLQTPEAGFNISLTNSENSKGKTQLKQTKAPYGDTRTLIPPLSRRISDNIRTRRLDAEQTHSNSVFANPITKLTRSDSGHGSDTTSSAKSDKEERRLRSSNKRRISRGSQTEWPI